MRNNNIIILKKKKQIEIEPFNHIIKKINLKLNKEICSHSYERK